MVNLLKKCSNLGNMDSITAYPMWKMFGETMPLLKGEFRETTLNTISKIIRSADFRSVIVYPKDPSISSTEYERIALKYKSFTTWLLGQFFYFLSCDKSHKSHDLFVEAQLCILRDLSSSQLSVYSDLIEIYAVILHKLVDFYEKDEQPITIKVFDPKADKDIEQSLGLTPLEIEISKSNHSIILLKIMKIFRFIVEERFLFQSIDGDRILDDLLYFLSEAEIDVKLEILSIFTGVVHYEYDQAAHKIACFRRLFEQIVQEIYNDVLEITEHQLKQFENVLIKYLNKEKNLTVVQSLLKSSLKTSIRNKPSPTVQNSTKRVVKDLEIELENLTIENIVENESILGVWALEFNETNTNLLFRNLQNSHCGTSCSLNKFLLIFEELSLKLLEETKSKRYIFNESQLILLMLKNFNQHFSNCTNLVNFNDFFNNLILLVDVKNWDLLYFVLSYCFVRDNPPNSFKDFGTNLGMFKKEFFEFCGHISRIDFNYLNSLKTFCNFIHILSSGLIEFDRTTLDRIFIKIFDKIMKLNEVELTTMVLQILPNYLSISNDPNAVIAATLIQVLSTENLDLLKTIIGVLPSIICTASANFQRSFNGKATEILCSQCKHVDTDLSLKTDISSQNLSIFLNRLIILSTKSDLNLLALDGFSSCSKHLSKFHVSSIWKIWRELCGNEDLNVRKKYSQVIGVIVKNCEDFEGISETTKNQLIASLFETLTKFSKESLIKSNFDLQLTILHTLNNLNLSKILPIIKILLYFIMVPTSKHSLIAVNTLFNLCEKQKSTPSETYKMYKKDICEIIAHLCGVNQALIGYNLTTSLKKISVTFEFQGSKDFVQRECHNLLPFFVMKCIKQEKVKELIVEMAEMQGYDVSELLTMNYGTIFLQAFLNETKENIKLINKYLETTTGQDSPSLRRRNFRVILNELLLNFHDHPEKVKTALTLLSMEEPNQGGGNTVQDYLQPKLLGLLQHFDFKLMSNTTNKITVLQSLADLFRFMGPKHLAPSRFKIIAMLRSVSYDAKELNCEIWEAFIRNCDVEALGPQLATIFVSLLPLLDSCQARINNIFKYLIIDNESATKLYIQDLFFIINESKVDHSVKNNIKKHVNIFRDCSLKEKIKNFPKYLRHETMEVRVRSLRHLKNIFEENRKELDQMILGYNGIDPIIVELIDIVTLECREKDKELKLACGELIGELGAVEPSHFPRRLAQNAKNFVFFVNDDNFIINALSELIKALQGEKNTHNMDRYALAIQEILKIKEISNDKKAPKYKLWTQFSPQQQDVMVPLLSSKYIIKQSTTNNFPCPIYGTTMGTSFQSWLFNWTCSLVSGLSTSYKSFFTVCLPAMKHDEKILMVFLPYILLHNLLENKNAYQMPYKEMTTIINSFNNKKKLDPNILNFRPFSLPNLVANMESITPEKVKQKQCIKVVFILIDFLDRWLRELLWQKGSEALNGNNFNMIQNFLSRFSKLKLAECNYQCAEYPRALMYLEDYINDNTKEINNNLLFLSEIYAQLDEADAVAGATALQVKEPSIEQRILALEVSGKLSDAAACYERMQPLKIYHIQGLMQCYLDLDNVNTALNFIQGALNKHPQYGDLLIEMQAEPLWRLGRYEEMEDLLNDLPNGKSWGLSLGRVLINHKKCQRDNFIYNLNELRKQQIDLLAATSLEEGTYQNGYVFVSKLHSLNELHQVEKATFDILLTPNDNSKIKEIIEHLKKEWDLRMKVVQQSVRIMEPMLCLRRVSLEIAKAAIKNQAPTAIEYLNNLLGECWLLSAKLARKSGIHQQAYTYTLKAEEYAPPKLFLEKAKLHWLREEHEQALITLKRGVEKILPNKNLIDTLTLEQKKICAEAKLLFAYYNDVISNLSTEINITNYKESIEIYKEWEKNFVWFGQYFDRIYQNYENDDDRDNKGVQIQLRIVDYFGKSLQYGTSYVHQSMPRMLSVWFDYGTRFFNLKDNAIKEERKDILLKLTKLIEFYLQKLEPWIFLTAFSQLVSRICHPQKEVYVELKGIITKLLLQYPQHTLWMIISIMKSSHVARSKRCSEIFNDHRLSSPVMSKLIKDFTNLAEKLIELCNKDVPDNVHSITVSQLLRSLPRMLNKADFSEIMIPTQKFRKLVLPNPDFKNSQYDPFPNQYVYIAGIEEDVTILASLQRPRKITFRGSDGKLYIQMLKPKDDLRKDFRLMEFNDVVNQLLAKDSESRQRRLNIRLYSVAPLNEECGLIEWLPDLIGLRPILMTLYKQKGLGMKFKEIKNCAPNLRDPLPVKKDIFTKKLIINHPAVLGEWFRRTFPDAQSWLIARTAYIRTTAVMSMAGYILGLGDRHGENILLDANCGDVVHVDFNCLFNKGETFDWPERVPFRLTHNMVNAMGPLGVEGIFRKSCACTLRVLRENTTTLMSIVTPFVYDPLVSWPRNVLASSNNTSEMTNGQAMEHIKNIELRLQGIVKTRSRITPDIKLSVDGQADNLINEATNIENLCQMYIGWGAYL